MTEVDKRICLLEQIIAFSYIVQKKKLKRPTYLSSKQKLSGPPLEPSSSCSHTFLALADVYSDFEMLLVEVAEQCLSDISAIGER